MPMAGFQDIPNEIAVDIFHFVQQDDLLSLSLTCKSIHDLVEPMLYSTLVQRSKSSIPLLIRTLLDKPGLARHLQTLRLHDIVFRRDIPEGEKQLHVEPLTKRHQQMVKSRLKKYMPPRVATRRLYIPNGNLKSPKQRAQEELHRWYTHMFKDPVNFESISSFLLLLLPNLKDFSIADYEIYDKLILSVIARARLIQRRQEDGAAIGSLSKLHTISLGISPAWENLVPFDRMVQILEVPSLRHVYCDGVKEVSPVSMRRESSIQHLSLYCRFHPLEVCPILSNIRDLQKLEFTYSASSLLPTGERLTFAALVQAITPVQNSLEELTVLDYKSESSESENQFPSMACFPKLRVLKIEGHFMDDCEDGDLAFADLPPVLSHLTVCRAVPLHIFGMLLANAERTETLPCLKRIHVQFQRESVCKDPKMFIYQWSVIKKWYSIHGIALSCAMMGCVTFHGDGSWWRVGEAEEDALRALMDDTSDSKQ